MGLKEKKHSGVIFVNGKEHHLRGKNNAGSFVDAQANEPDARSLQDALPVKTVESAKSVEKIAYHPRTNHTDLRKPINQSKVSRRKMVDSFAPVSDLRAASFIHQRTLDKIKPAAKVPVQAVQDSVALEQDNYEESYSSEEKVILDLINKDDDTEKDLKAVEDLRTEIATPQEKEQVRVDQEVSSSKIEVKNNDEDDAVLSLAQRREQLHNARMQRAARIAKSKHISRFSQPQTEYNSAAETMANQDKKETEDVLPISVVSVAPKLQASPQQHFPAAKLPTREEFEAKKRAKKKTIVVRFLETTQNIQRGFSFSFGQRMLPAMASALSVLLVVGYISYLNIPNLAIRVAANRAGFDATLPAYTPTGYAFKGPVEYSDGQVIVDFAAKDNNKQQFAVIQKKSNMDSLSLLETHIKPQTSQYNTYKKNGLTIYTYNGSQASWVNRGVWYTINGHENLNESQLVQVASSL